MEDWRKTKGWQLVSLHKGNPGSIFVSFAHYTGRTGPHGGVEYDKVLEGEVTPDTLRHVLKPYLTLQPGNEKKERR